jgi:undecaprenyl diphosphate synthase
MDPNKPNHIAIIPDGNRRWGNLRGLTKQQAYARGIGHIEEVLEWCKEKDVKILSMWGFSTDNFSRDKDEIGGLFELFKTNLKGIIESANKKKKEVKIKFIGRTNLFPFEIQQMMKLIESQTENNSGYQLNLMLAYGGREELVDAVNELLKEGKKEVTEQDISDHVYTKGIPDPDLIIRTSGEQRLSGLMPWQSVYSEFFFSPKLWPDFSKEDFEEALEEYTRRKRRFGK